MAPSPGEKLTGSDNDDEPQLREQVKRLDGNVVTKADSHPSSSSPRHLKRTSTTPIPTPHFSATPSATTSPKPSRETSPIRPPLKPANSATSKSSRSRKNSQDLSPNRAPGPSIPTVPSAAAIQRALSAAGAPQLQSPASLEFNLDATKPQRSSKGFGAGNTQFTPHVPRVKSPPPSTSSTKSPLYSSRKSEPPSSTPSIVLERPAPVPGRHEGLGEGEGDSIVPSGMRTPVRGMSSSGPTLETVQESSIPSTPSTGIVKTNNGETSESDHRPELISENLMEDAFAKDPKLKMESGSESGGNKSTGATGDNKGNRKTTTTSNAVKPQIMHPKKSLTQLHPAKAKTGSEGTIQNMTVETETVSTIPQVALGGGAGDRNILGRVETGGSLRLKPSNETIRPKKEKRRVTRKAPSLNSGTGGSSSRRFHHHHIPTRPSSPKSTVSLSTANMFSPSFVPDRDSEYATRSGHRQQEHAQRQSREYSPPDSDSTVRPFIPVLTNFRGRTASSKADIFEAKVASAVDEVNSSDSEETFVYESNPPEPLSVRPHRFHSRTPSATSTASQMDQHGAKGRQDGHHSIAGKKSMKFANNSYHTAGYPGESNDGTVRGPNQSGRIAAGNPPHHHHIGRYGRGGAGHPSLFDSDSPFSNATRPLRAPASNVARLSPRSNPRSPNLAKNGGSQRKPSESMLYDLEGEGADDERTPLVGSTRSTRTRYSRRPTSGPLRNGNSSDEKRKPFCRRLTAYISLGTLVAIFIAVIPFVYFMCSKPLYNVRIKDIRNVLASEQEIMLDMHVHAVNPNLIAIQVSDLDVNIFAKSKHVGTNASWRERDKYRKVRPGFRTGDPLDVHFQRAHRHQPLTLPDYHEQENVDEGTDPIEDPETDLQTMLLGRIFGFDSPLVFDASPLHRREVSAIGELRLAKPGNRTEEGGTERWEKVIQHDFELIVRGVLRYSAPLTSKVYSAPVSGSVLVHPGGGEDRMDSHLAPARSSYTMKSNTVSRQADKHGGIRRNFVG